MDGRDRVLLNGSGGVVATQVNVLEHDRVKTAILVRIDGVDANFALLVNLNFGDARNVSFNL